MNYNNYNNSILFTSCCEVLLFHFCFGLSAFIFAPLIVVVIIILLSARLDPGHKKLPRVLFCLNHKINTRHIFLCANAHIKVVTRLITEAGQQHKKNLAGPFFSSRNYVIVREPIFFGAMLDGMGGCVFPHPFFCGRKIFIF